MLILKKEVFQMNKNQVKVIKPICKNPHNPDGRTD